MKISTNWRGNKKIDRTKRVRPKPKIRWQHLGLTDPGEERSIPSMDEIRRQVVTLSSRGLGHAVRSRPVAPSGSSDKGAPHQGTPGRPKRRGATE